MFGSVAWKCQNYEFAFVEDIKLEGYNSWSPPSLVWDQIIWIMKIII